MKKNQRKIRDSFCKLRGHHLGPVTSFGNRDDVYRKCTACGIKIPNLYPLYAVKTGRIKYEDLEALRYKLYGRDNKQ